MVSTGLEVRKDRFSKLVKRVVAHARNTKGWSLGRLLQEAEVSKPAYYRWVNMTWTESPEPALIERFFDAADWPVADAFDILWPGKVGKREATAPAPLPADIELIMRALNDPNTPAEDLVVIKATLDMLLARIDASSTRRKGA